MPGSQAIVIKLFYQGCQLAIITRFSKSYKMGINQLCSVSEVPLTEFPFLPQGLMVVQKNPTLTDQQQQFLSRLQEFPYQEVMSAPLLKAGKEYYQGKLDNKKQPCGKGIYYTEHKAIFMGTFKGREADPFLYYVLPNGAYFAGALTQTEIDYATFQDPQAKFRYDGQLKQSSNDLLRFIPHGAGSQKTSQYKFDGIYNSGKRIKGRLVWTCSNFECIYEGDFDQQGHFSGYGILQEQTGKYRGQFFNGLKHGRGRYEYKSMLTYQGDYYHGIKNGKGSILNSDGTLSYQGQFYEGLPHGEGTAFMGDQPRKARFVHGLPQQYQQLLNKAEDKIPMPS